jgi:hypothetical protein
VPANRLVTSRAPNSISARKAVLRQLRLNWRCAIVCEGMLEVAKDPGAPADARKRAAGQQHPASD